MKWWLVVLLSACVTPNVDRPLDKPRQVEAAAAPRQAVRAFLEAVDHRDFARALTLLGPPWSERYTSERLAADFAAEPLAIERVSRLRRAVDGPLAISGSHATLSIDPSRTAELALIDGSWRLLTLE